MWWNVSGFSSTTYFIIYFSYAARFFQLFCSFFLCSLFFSLSRLRLIIGLSITTAKCFYYAPKDISLEHHCWSTYFLLRHSFQLYFFVLQQFSTILLYALTVFNYQFYYIFQQFLTISEVRKYRCGWNKTK